MNSHDLRAFIIDVSGYLFPFVDWLRKEIDSAELHNKLQEALEEISEMSEQLSEIKRLMLYGKLNAAVNLIQDSQLAFRQDTVDHYLREANSKLNEIASSDHVNKRIQALTFFWMASIAFSQGEQNLHRQYMFSSFCQDSLLARTQLAPAFFEREIKLDVDKEINPWYEEELQKLRQKDYREAVYRIERRIERTFKEPDFLDTSGYRTGRNYTMEERLVEVVDKVLIGYELPAPAVLERRRHEDLERLQQARMKRLDDACSRVACSKTNRH